MVRLFALCFASVLLLSLIPSPTSRDILEGAMPALEQLHQAPASHLLDTDFSDYQWPTDAGRIVTSVFAEYRSTHFHGGMDISTGDETGFRVFAARNGYVARVSVNPSGYGNMLWLRHPDGYYTTYAHLRNFADTLDAVVRKEQTRLERFPVDIEFTPTDFPVHKGDVIAYTGESGTGSPHLHFEIRDREKNFVSPFLCTQFTFPDDSLPRFYRLALTPLGESSSVNNSFASHTIEFGAPPNGSATLREQPVACGTFGFALDVRDRINGSRFRNGVAMHQLFLDDSLIFAVRFERAPSGDGFEIGLYYDFDLIAHSGGKMAKLYKDYPNDLPIYQTPGERAGIINTKQFSEGVHRFRVVTTDVSHHTSELSGSILFTKEPSFTQTKKTDIPAASKGLSYDVKQEFVRVFLRTEGNVLSLPSIGCSEGASTRNLRVFRIDANLFTAAFRPLESYQGKRTVIAEYSVRGRLRTVSDEFFLHPILPNTPAEISFDGGRLRIRADSLSVYKPLFLEIRKLSGDFRYSLLPRFTVLNKGLEVRMHADGNPKQALYFHRTGSRWGLLSTKREGAYLVGRLERTLGDVAALTDVSPPTVSRLALPQQFTRRPHTVSFAIHDNLSGVEYKELKLYIDNVFAIPVIDGEQHRVTHRFAEPLTRGSHTVTIRAMDKVGNAVEIRRSFSIR